MHRLAPYSIAGLALFAVACSKDIEGAKVIPLPTSVDAASSAAVGVGGAGGSTDVGGAGPGGAGSASVTQGAGGGGGALGAGGGAGGAGGGIDCSVDGAPGQCIDTAACAALAGYSSTPGYCPGPANIECCTKGPSVADNPPTPAGWKLMAQADVTPEMTAWAVSILDDPMDYPMFSTAMMTFGALTVLARVEWHPPDFQNDVVHRGVTLYEPS